MSKLLKGNYPLATAPKSAEEPSKPAKETSTQTFERRALEQLGGSIAFVMKKNTFVWKGDAPGAAGPDRPA